MKLGLFGGTFNPIHFGHLSVATEVYKKFSFDHIYFIPSKKPPHKENKKITHSNIRCEMILRSFNNDLPFRLSKVEIMRKGSSYTVNTVNHFESISSNKDKLYFILGLDSFLELHTWKSYIDLAHKIKLIIVSRYVSSSKCKKLNNDIRLVKNYISKKISSKYSFCANNLSWKHDIMKTIYLLKIKPINISSTLIREHVKLGKNFDSFVPKSVAEYISKKGLYL